MQQLYQANRELVSENAKLCEQNCELQQLSCQTKCELDKYTQWAKEAGTEELMQRLEQLQDMLYQLKESTDVSLIVDSSSQIQKLNGELSQKERIITELKDKLAKMIGAQGALRRDEDLVEYMGNAIKEKDGLIAKLQAEQAQLVVSFYLCLMSFIYSNGNLSSGPCSKTTM